MQAYILRRLILTIPVLLVVSFLVYSLLMLIPGDPVMAMLGEQFDQKLYDTVKHELGLDKPLWEQYPNWLWKAVQGDFGRSLRTREPVGPLIIQYLPRTMYLILFSMVVSLLIALPAAIISALRRNTWADMVASVGAMLGVAIPNFWLAIMMILVFSVHFRWFPVTGYVEPWKDPLLSLKHMVLPGVALGVALAAEVTRQTRSGLVEVLEQDYIRTAYAKGLGERTVVLVHAMKNALIPVVTIVGLQMGRLFGGAVVIEAMFAIPGMGTLLVNGVLARDFRVVQPAVLVLTLAVLLSNLLVDVIYAYLDPRIKYT